MADNTVLYVEKDTDLMRATLVAIGLANLFYRLIPSDAGGLFVSSTRLSRMMRSR